MSNLFSEEKTLTKKECHCTVRCNNGANQCECCGGIIKE